MITHIRCVILGTCLLLASTVSSAELRKPVREDRVIHGGGTTLHKAAGDTIVVMGPTGSGATYLGDFEAGWNGWTSVDVTQPTVTHWQVSDYNQTVPGNLAAWCGDSIFRSCDGVLDPAGGYGNSWHELLSYRTTVADPGAGATVLVNATLQYDTEPTYDFVYLSAKVNGRVNGSFDFVDLTSWDGTATTTVNETFTYLPSELIDGTDVYVLFRFRSDGAWSDADCSFSGAGACQIDDITVTTTQTGQTAIVSVTDFQDGTFGDWFADFPDGVGNFAALWSNLQDRDPCGVNLSQQVAFIDDGLVVPGTGGTKCISWCYGPGGYIVNNTGGLAGGGHLSIDLFSPVMAWPNADYDGITFGLDVYRHELFTPESPGIFVLWDIRSADTDNSAGNGHQTLEGQFSESSFPYFGGPDYFRLSYDVTDQMNAGRDEIQLRLSVIELGWAWGVEGNDGTTAPYFDNVSVKVFPIIGPAMTTRETDLAQDNFPAVDAIDFADLGSMHVRFDMADNISNSSDLRNDPGDSIVVSITPARAGAALTGTPELHYVIDANPAFDAYRTIATSGVVAGVPASGVSGIIPDRYAFDLPDTGTIFPGDVLHYYIRAGDDVDGDIQYATLPADRTGFGDFSDPLAYDSSFVVHALPTITSDGSGGFEVPQILFWNDFGNRGGEAEWYDAFRHSGLVAGSDYDIYYTNAASRGVGNGIGGRTAGPALEHYSELFYTAGDLGFYTISNGDFDDDASDDIATLLTWLSAGNKDLFLTGDNLVTDLTTPGDTDGAGFVQTVMGLDHWDGDIRPVIQNQATPLVIADVGNPVFQSAGTWIAYGACKGINTFDAVTPRAGAMRLAEFADPSGIPGIYSYAAATLNVHNSSNRVISLPYDFMSIYTDPNAKAAAPMSGRALVLRDVLNFFAVGVLPPDPADVPGVEKFAIRNHPNPFNPSTRISYTIDKPGHFALKIFNVRGQLVRTLIDGRVETSGHVTWDGTDDDGATVASGVYFREGRLGDQVEVGKMALLK